MFVDRHGEKENALGPGGLYRRGSLDERFCFAFACGDPVHAAWLLESLSGDALARPKPLPRAASSEQSR